MLERLKRIELGMLLATAMGFLYALISQTINQVVIKDIQLHTGMPSPLTMILIIVLAAVVLGFLASLPANAVYGALLSGSAGGVLLTIKAFLTDSAPSQTFLSVVATIFSVFVPSAILFMILALMLRWSVKQLLEGYFIRNKFSLDHFLPILLPLFVAAFMGGVSLKNAEFRHDLHLVDAHLKQANLATTITDLPESLQAIPGFFIHRNEPYQLEPSTDIDLYAGEPPEGILEREKGIILVHYEDGFKLTCLTIDESDRVICEVFVPLSERSIE
jgi:hypothetical protein